MLTDTFKHLPGKHDQKMHGMRGPSLDDARAGTEFVRSLEKNDSFDYGQDFAGPPPIQWRDVRNTYTDEGYKWMNNFLRTGQYYEQSYFGGKKALDYSIDVMDAHARASTLPRSVTVYRGIEDKALHQAIQKDPQSLIGRRFQDKGYVSTSTHRKTAELFSDSAGEEPPEDWQPMSVIFRMPLKKGTHMIPGNRGEQEIILPRGGNYRITGVDPATFTLSLEYEP